LAYGYYTLINLLAYLCLPDISRLGYYPLTSLFGRSIPGAKAPPSKSRPVEKKILQNTAGSIIE